MEKKFQLGETVRIKMNHCEHPGLIAKIIGSFIQERGAYRCDYCVTTSNYTDNIDRPIKIYVQECDIERIREVRAYCYQTHRGDYVWHSQNLSEKEQYERSIRRYAHFDFVKTIVQD